MSVELVSTEWWGKIYSHICSPSERKNNVDKRTTINSVVHADTTTILAVGGNYTTVLGYSAETGHHTEKGKVALLKSLASDLGYKLVKK